MQFAIVELKYVPKKFFIVQTDRIKDFKKKNSVADSYLCYISTDWSEEPNFLANYSQKYDGVSGVFIRKITGSLIFEYDATKNNLDSLEAAIAYQKDKRINSVPAKFRVPQNTDSELNVAEKKRKRNEKRTQKLNKENASMKNSSYLADLVKSQLVSSENEDNMEDLLGNPDCDSIEDGNKKVANFSNNEIASLNACVKVSVSN